MIARIMLASAWLAGPALLHAQPAAVSADQIAPAANGAATNQGIGTEQIVPGSSTAAFRQGGLTSASDPTPAQLSKTGGEGASLLQLSTPAPHVDAAQLGRPAGNVTAPPPPLSSPAQGRNTAVAPVGGHDRCDPDIAGRALPKDCARILERRAGEFAKPAVEPLSAEQRLLVTEERAAPPAAGSDASLRRIGTGQSSDEAIAGVVRQIAPATAAAAPPSQSQSEQAATVNGVLSSLGIPPGSAVTVTSSPVSK